MPECPTHGIQEWRCRKWDHPCPDCVKGCVACFNAGKSYVTELRLDLNAMQGELDRRAREIENLERLVAYYEAQEDERLRV